MEEGRHEERYEDAIQRPREERAIILDFLPNGYPFDSRPNHRKTPIIQAIGKEHFTLLELVPKKEIHLQLHADVYIGEGKREEIHHINGKLMISKLTATARSELSYIIDDLIDNNEKKFVEFFNNALPLTTRMHQLELLPGLGKKHMWEIVEERKGDPFKSFADIKKRIKLLPDPKKAIQKRILAELEGNEKHRLFVDM
jgi:putative nucleotide binding protein